MRPMRIRLVTPAPRGTRFGNRITAVRWAKILRDLGHSAKIETTPSGTACDLLIALHARRSAPAIFDFHEQYPNKPSIVALTGTDVYCDIKLSAEAQRAVEIATRVVALQPLAPEELAPHVRESVRIIYQSAEPTRKAPRRSTRNFLICVAGHLREVKDPFRAAIAARSLPESSRIQVLHVGAAMSEEMHERARAEQQRNHRYFWYGELPRYRVRQFIASSHLLVLSSRMEGGANVISEAVVDGTPVVASRIPGSVGLLGADYPGFYPVGDTGALCDLLLRAESDAAFYAELCVRCAAIAPLFDPNRERDAWRDLIAELRSLFA